MSQNNPKMMMRTVMILTMVQSLGLVPRKLRHVDGKGFTSQHLTEKRHLLRTVVFPYLQTRMAVTVVKLKVKGKDKGPPCRISFDDENVME